MIQNSKIRWDAYMHEFSMTSQIVKLALEEAQRRGAKKVLEVRLVIGKLTFLAIEQVRFSYKLLVKNTIMEGSKLHIEQREGTVECDNCGYKGTINSGEDPIYHFSFPTLTCPKCGSTVRIVEGKECIVKGIRLAV